MNTCSRDGINLPHIACQLSEISLHAHGMFQYVFPFQARDMFVAQFIPRFFRLFSNVERTDNLGAGAVSGVEHWERFKLNIARSKISSDSGSFSGLERHVQRLVGNEVGGEWALEPIFIMQ